MTQQRRLAGTAPPPEPGGDRLTRLLTALVEMGRSFGRTEDRQTLVDHACRIAVDVAGYRAAWIGLRDPASPLQIEPLASAGRVAAIIPGLRVDLAAEPPGFGLVSTALHEERTIVANDALRDPLLAPWRPEVISDGYRAIAAIPVFIGSTVEGIGVFYADEPGVFTPGEVALLERVMGDLGFRLDILEREAARRAAEARFGVLFTQSTAPVLIMRAHTIVAANSAAIRLFRFGTEAAATGRSLDELQVPLRADRTRPSAPSCLFANGPRTDELRLYRDDGTWLVARLDTASLEIAGGPALAVFVTDVTDQHATRQYLQASERRYRLLLEQASDAIFVSDPDGRYVEVNDAACALLGYGRDELLGLDIGQLVPPGALPRQTRTLGRLAAGETVLGEWTLLRRDGVPVETEISARQLPDGRVHAIVRDITPRRAAEAERDRLAAVVAQMTDSVLVTDLAGRIVYANAAFERLSGYPVARALGVRPANLVRPTGQSESVSAEIDTATAGGAPWSGRIDLQRADATTLDVDLNVIPLRDEHGVAIGSIEIARDVSREVALEAQLRQSQKLEAIGRLAGGVAHDFNNQLTAITGFADLAAGSLPPDSPAVDDLAEIRRAADRAIELTRHLLAFSRKQVLEPQALDLGAVIAGIVPMLRRLIGAHIRLAIRSAPGMAAAYADPSQLEHAIVNLAVNARDAMPNGGTLTLESGDAEIDEDFAAAHPGATPGAYVILSVSDTGAGMSRDVLEHVFDPFFTTKPTGAGTGLGLATVFGIVKQSGGYVFASSEPGRGATFDVYLPRTGATPVAQAPMERQAASPGGTETILVVEDEESVRGFVERVLGARGYHVLTAPNGSEAVETAQTHEGRIDLLFTDIVMPGMSGIEVIDLVRRVRPEARVLCTSGYAEGGAIESLVLDPGIPFLGKPYAASALLTRVRAVLDADI